MQCSICLCEVINLKQKLSIGLTGLIFLFSFVTYAQDTFEEKQVSQLEKEYRIVFEETRKLYQEKEFTVNNRETAREVAKILILLRLVNRGSKETLANYMLSYANNSAIKHLEKRLSLIVLGSRSLENSLDASKMYIYYGQDFFNVIRDKEFIIAKDVYDIMTQ